MFDLDLKMRIKKSFYMNVLFSKIETLAINALFTCVGERTRLCYRSPDLRRTAPSMAVYVAINCVSRQATSTPVNGYNIT